MAGTNIMLDELLFSEANNAAGTSSQTVNGEPANTAHVATPEKPQVPAQPAYLGPPKAAVPAGSGERATAYPSVSPPAATPAPAQAPAQAQAPTAIAPVAAASLGLSLVSVQGAMDNTMKKYAENLLGKLTQMTAKLDSLTEKTDRLERLVEVSQNATKTLEKSMDNRLRVLEQGFNEIQRNVQALRDKAELEQEAKDLKKMSLSDEHDQSKVPFESEMSKAPALPAPIRTAANGMGQMNNQNSHGSAQYGQGDFRQNVPSGQHQLYNNGPSSGSRAYLPTPTNSYQPQQQPQSQPQQPQQQQQQQPQPQPQQGHGASRPNQQGVYPSPQTPQGQQQHSNGGQGQMSYAQQPTGQQGNQPYHQQGMQPPPQQQPRPPLQQGPQRMQPQPQNMPPPSQRVQQQGPGMSQPPQGMQPQAAMGMPTQMGPGARMPLPTPLPQSVNPGQQMMLTGQDNRYRPQMVAQGGQQGQYIPKTQPQQPMEYQQRNVNPPIEKIFDDIVAMGFKREDVHMAIQRLRDQNRPIDMNTMLDSLPTRG